MFVCNPVLPASGTLLKYAHFHFRWQPTALLAACESISVELSTSLEREKC